MSDNKSAIDVYSFKIDNYTKLKSLPVPFGELSKTTDINNGLIKSNLKDHNTAILPISRMISNVDYIKSNLSINNKYYILYKEKNAKDKTKYKLTNKYIDEFANNMLSALDKLKNNYKTSTKMFDDMNINLQEAGFIKKVMVDEKEKIIIFGDHHGSYHTFFRNLLRLQIMNVINLNTFKINDNYRLIFLGDIVDRGHYSLEILDILFHFVNNNPIDKIILNRGNHEELSQNKVDGLLVEIKSKIPNNHINIHKQLNELFSYYSTAIILLVKNTTKKYWLCHGLVSTNEQLLTYINTFIKDDNFNIMLLKIADAYQIRWNDTSKLRDKLSDSKLSNENIDSVRSTIAGYIYNVGLTMVNKYLEIFDFIIRGHEDSYANAWLLQNNKKRIFVLSKDYKKYTTPQFELHKDHNILKDSKNNIILIHTPNNIKQIDRPIQTIYKTNFNSDIMNVLTISTNTDYGRTLSNDSFIVLRFNNESLVTVNDVLTNKTNITDWLNKKDDINIFENNTNIINTLNKYYKINYND